MIQYAEVRIAGGPDLHSGRNAGSVAHDEPIEITDWIFAI